MTQASDNDGSGKGSDPFASVAAKRPAPPDVAPVTFEGVRYEQATRSSAQAEDGQRTGFLAAYREAGDDLLWTIRVYSVEIDKRLERDVQEIYFVSMALLAAQRQLLIENEAGERYLVNVDDQSVLPAP